MPAPRSIDEQLFRPRTVEEAQQLYEALVTHARPAQARSVLTWLLLPPDNPANPATSRIRKSEYRRVLKLLKVPPWATEAMGACISSGDESEAA